MPENWVGLGLVSLKKDWDFVIIVSEVADSEVRYNLTRQQNKILLFEIFLRRQKLF